MSSCRLCKDVCPVNAVGFVTVGIDVGEGVVWGDSTFILDKFSCILCGACAEVCPTMALTYSGGGGGAGNIPIPPEGGGGGTGSEALPPLKMTKEDQAKYPRFTETIKNLRDYVKNNPKVLQALKDYSGLTEAQILDKLKFGNGPAVKITEIGDNSKYGYFNGKENANVLNVNASFVRGLEAAQLVSTMNATSFLLAVTALHEFVHYSRFFNGLDRNKEYGLAFERDAYGITIDRDNAGKYSWTFYKK